MENNIWRNLVSDKNLLTECLINVKSPTPSSVNPPCLSLPLGMEKKRRKRGRKSKAEKLRELQEIEREAEIAKSLENINSKSEDDQLSLENKSKIDPTEDLNNDKSNSDNENEESKTGRRFLRRYRDLFVL